MTLICSPGAGLDHLADSQGVEVIAVPMARNPEALSDLASLGRLFVRLRTLRPNAIVYATPKASLLTAIASFVCRVPVRVYEQWGLRLETTKGVERRCLSMLERATAALSTIVVPNSQSLARSLRDAQLTGRTPVRILGAGSSHGVDLDHFSRRANTSPLDSDTTAFVANARGLVIGFVGRLAPDKGLDTLLAALTICRRSGTDVRAIIVGGDDGPSPIHGQSQVEKQLVHFTGHASDPRPYYRAMDVLVLPSRREGFPNVVLEAAAMCVPAIVSDATGCSDAVSHEVTGLLFEVGSPGALADAITRLAADRELVRTLGCAARLRAERDYSQQTIWSLHESLLRNLVEQSREGVETGTTIPQAETGRASAWHADASEIPPRETDIE
ncbi:hypothetical protein BW730_16465 [Tessaracoccus aquimaris]|uniref:Glycosyltransferase subfamily 4-like N-terminal domain-containing protein n=1 Tax=Tessaracoccus aquimaris TaxID=1332264 RepID=A0A1Q2CRT5_9ACTN|nr:hypothetical protein BW730_16465 [Tessaracoccus aquimaris]